MSELYSTGILKSEKFTAYNSTFEPRCHATHDEDHSYHKNGQGAANTANDLLIGIWEILKNQAKWLEEKLQEKEGIPQGNALSQADLNKLIQETRNIVKKATTPIEDQNDELLQRLASFKKDIEKAISVETLDDRFGHIEKVVRDCLADVENKIAKLQKLGRDILEEVVNASGKTELEKLVLENNKILKNLEQGKSSPQSSSDVGNIKIPGLELLATKQDVEKLGKEIDPPTLVRKDYLKQLDIILMLGENQDLLKKLDIDAINSSIKSENKKLEEILKDISKKVDDLSSKASGAEDVENAQHHLDNISRLLRLRSGMEP
ncbi:hypothetical protein Tsubulata_002056 [Turnera subulata]|uniref:Uncharacterized protein n=1 Tax=Turnera subulata TaxID=218843 RepID=A0A9Q0FZF4_9ROSI|nr:hypothetical protein Tsubulata_002056 [Turnera subulata]